MKPKEKSLEEKRRLALALFAQGYNCAQAVAGALTPDLGIDQQDALLLAAALGGGLAGTHEQTCGALLGGLMALGAYAQDGSPEGKEMANAVGEKLLAAFAGRNGCLRCGDLLAQEDMDARSAADPRLSAYPDIRPCARLVVDVIDAVHDISCAKD